MVSPDAAACAPTWLEHRFGALLGIDLAQVPRALRLLSFIFVVSLGLVVLKAAQSGIILAAYPDTRAILPRAFTLSALLLASLSSVSAAATVRIGPAKLASRGLVGAALAILALRLLLHVDRGEGSAHFAPLAAYAVIEATSGVLLIQCWSLVSEAVDPRSAKQILPAAGIGASLAWTIGGVLVPALVRLIGAPSLLLIAPFLFLGGAAIGRIVGARDAVHARERGGKRARVGVVEGWKQGFGFILGSPLMRVVMALAVLALASEQLLDFMLMSSAKDRLHTQAAISSFFGAYYGITSAISLAILSGVSGRLLGRLRASEALAITPVTTSLLTVGMLLVPGLPAAALMRGGDRVLKQSLWSAAMEQAQTPLPSSRRAQARALIRGVIAPLGYAVVAVALSTLPAGFDLRLLAVGSIAMTSVMATLILGAVRKRYVAALREAIDRRRLVLAAPEDEAAAPFDAVTLDADAIVALEAEIAGGDPARAALAIELLATTASMTAAPALIQACEHASSEARESAVEGLGELRTDRGTEREAGALIEALATRLQRDPIASVRRGAARGLRVQLARLRRRRDDAGSARAVARSAVDKGRSDTHRQVRALCEVTRVEDAIRTGRDRTGALVALLESPDDALREAALTAITPRLARHPVLQKALRGALADPSGDVRAQALRVVMRSRVESLLVDVAPLLVDARLAPTAFEELASWGDDALSVASQQMPSLVASQQAAPLSRVLEAPQTQRGPGSQRGAPVSSAIDSRPISRLLQHADPGVRDGVAAAMTRVRNATIPRLVLEPMLDREISGLDTVVSVLAGVARDAGVSALPLPPPFTALGHELALRLDEGRVRVLRLLALAESRTLADLVRVGLRDGGHARRAHVLELLESTLARPLARRIVPIFERTELAALKVALEAQGRLTVDAFERPFEALRARDGLVNVGDGALRSIALLAYAGHAGVAHEPDNEERTMIPLYERMLFLRSVPMLQELNIEDLRRVAEIVEPMELTAGDALFRKGEPGEDLFLVSRGAIVSRDDGRDVARHGERDLVGELSVLDQEPHTEDAICVEDAIVLRLRGVDFAELMAQRPQIQEQIMRMLVRRLRAVTRRARE